MPTSWHGAASQIDVIMTGVRLQRREGPQGVRAAGCWSMSSAAAMLVQYNKMEFNQQQCGPFPAKGGGNRVSDEDVPVTMLQREHPVFHARARSATSRGRTGSGRGLCFLGEKDRVASIWIMMVDSFPDNPGVKLGFGRRPR